MAHTAAVNDSHPKNNLQFNDFVAFIFIILFIYVGGSKFFELEKFKATFEFMPFMRPFSWPLAITVPTIEVGTAVLFHFQKYRKTALIITTILMTAFTVFTMFITKFAGTTPCTCGGVIQHLSWKNHLYLNSFLLLISIAGLLLALKPKNEIKLENQNLVA